MGVDLSIILATYNESTNLPIILESIDSLTKLKKQCIFIDDGSTDSTRSIILEYVGRDTFSKYIFNDSKQSTLRAQSQGIHLADSEFVIIMDSDLQHPPDLIPQIYEKLVSGYDIVTASRYVNGGSTGNRNAVRGVISRVASFLAKMLLKTTRKTTDPLSGYFGFRKTLFRPINDKWRGYKLQLFILAENPSAQCYDIPYRFKERESGKSKVTDGSRFLINYLTELILAKKVELVYRKGVRQESSGGKSI
jgi:dolichol-phosphate mannosyltransferase